MATAREGGGCNLYGSSKSNKSKFNNTFDSILRHVRINTWISCRYTIVNYKTLMILPLL
ncbi:hypothetical protein SAMN05443582_101305 [Phyllobacterium sp. OV277]|nr:hypothetical protein SAMN05443582_101305 [Phyllobacterium sp. OV277]